MTSPYNIKYWIDKGFSEPQARIEIAKRRPTNILYWTNKGYTTEESKIKVKEHQSLGMKSRLEKKKKDPYSYNKTQITKIEYWLEKGYTEEEAKKKISERQSTFSKEKCIKTPLYFDRQRLNGLAPKMGDYYICISQSRVEKGVQYLSKILAYCDSSVKVIAAYNNETQAKIAIERKGFQPYIDSGVLEIKYDLKWETGLAELVAGSRGVIIPSIWPTTTEFGLLEALGFKKPVFSFDIGIHREVIINGINGFTVALGDSKAMASQMLKLKVDDRLYSKVSENAGLLYKELTDWNGWKKDLKKMGV